MSWGYVRGCVVVLVGIVMIPAMSHGQEIETSPSLWAERSFGELRSWKNIVEPQRLPIEDRPVFELGERGIIPPQIRPQGLTPRFSLIHEYNDNIFFTADNRVDDFVTVFSPGLHYTKEVSRGRLEADYAFESAVYANNPGQNQSMDAQSGLLSGGVDISKRTRVEFFERFHSFRDPTEQDLPGAGAPSRRRLVLQNVVDLTGRHDFTPLVNMFLRYGHILSDFKDPQQIGSMTSDGEAGIQVQLTHRDRLDVRYRFRFFDFANARKVWTHAAMLDHEHEASETLILRGRLGVVGTGNTPSRIDILAQGSLRAALKRATFEIGYDRDLFAAGGVGSVFVAQTISGSVAVRLAKGLHVGAGVDFSIFNDLARKDTEFQILQPKLTLTYAVQPWLIVRLGYTFIRQEAIEFGIIPTNNRLALSFTVSL
jgi:hypothetical protein